MMSSQNHTTNMNTAKTSARKLRKVKPSARNNVAILLVYLAAFHSITSSARASSVGGISRPSAFAVLRLITNSYLVGACTGRLAGFSPLRMRSTYPAALLVLLNEGGAIRNQSSA